MTHDDIGERHGLDAALEETFKDIGLPARPQILDRISVEMIKEEPNFRHLGQLIGADMSLSASLIKTANSPFFGFQSRARSPQEALMMLGLDVASQAIAGICLRNAFALDKNLEALLHKSAQIAALSGWLTRDVGEGRLRTDQAYTYGLFRDCGIPVMLKRFPRYAAVLARANTEALLGFTQVERLGLPEFPIDHALVGCLLARSWWLPEEICLAIRHHHERAAIDAAGSALPEASRAMIATGQLAEHILQQVSGNSDTQEWPKLGSACLRLLNLGEDKLPPIYMASTAILKKVD